MKKILEKQTQKAISDWLEYNGWQVIKFNNVGIFKKNGQYIPPRRKGIADLFAFKEGYRPLAVEVKAGKNTASEEQVAFGVDFGKHGGRYLIARSIDEVEKALLGGTIRTDSPGGNGGGGGYTFDYH